MINVTAKNIQSREGRRVYDERTPKRRRIISDKPNGKTPKRVGEIKITSAPFAVTSVTNDKCIEEMDLDMEQVWEEMLVQCSPRKFLTPRMRFALRS